MVKVRVYFPPLIMELDVSSPTDLGSPYRRWPHISPSEGAKMSPRGCKLELACSMWSRSVYRWLKAEGLNG